MNHGEHGSITEQTLAGNDWHSDLKIFLTSYFEYASRPIYNCHPLLVVIRRSVHRTRFPVFSAQENNALHLLYRIVTLKRGKFISRIVQVTLSPCTPVSFLFFSPSLLSRRARLTGRIQTSDALLHGLYCSGLMCDDVTLWYGWGGVVSVCRLKHYCNSVSAFIRIPHHTTPAKPQHNTNTHRTRTIQPMK